MLERADPAPALHQGSEDAQVPKLLDAGLTAWIAEQGPSGDDFSVDPQAGGKPALHARLRRSIDAELEDEEHWAFRAVCAPHHIAALNRIRNAVTGAGLTEGVTKRRLFLLRNPDWSQGTRTQEVIQAFENAGGRTLKFPDSDVRQLVALAGLIEQYGKDGLRPWFAARRVTRSIGFLREALREPSGPPARRKRAPRPQRTTRWCRSAPPSTATRRPASIWRRCDGTSRSSPAPAPARPC